MKTYLLLLILVFSANMRLVAQCTANAGGVLHRCSPDSSVQLGGNPTAVTGVPPFSYEWSIEPIAFVPPAIPYLYASDILGDTTAANPFLLYNNVGDSIAFFLKITDSFGCISRDTMILTTTHFGIHLLSWNYYINPGDSVYLNEVPNIGSGYGTTFYDWDPSHGLSDTTLFSGFWAKPDTSTSYTATVTDSKGCSRTAQEPTYHVYVNTVGLNESNLPESPLTIYPNPVDGSLQLLAHDMQIEGITLLDLNGKTLLKKEGSLSELKLPPVPAGIYILEVNLSNGKVVRKEIIKK